MEKYDLQGGLHTVFEYKGLNTNYFIFQYIFGIWLTDSKYELDNRFHFEIMGKKYENKNPKSEEEIWIPIKDKLLGNTNYNSSWLMLYFKNLYFQPTKFICEVILRMNNS